jgi:leader peptidase (prepilin peptidase)/N-methyltransferase
MALVELLTGCLFILALFTVGLGPLLFKAEILIAFLVVITFIDFDCQLILDKVVVWLAGTGVVINSLLLWVDWTPYFPLTGSSFGGIGWMDLLLAALIGGGIMLFLAVISGGGLGGGDIKFVAALGLWFGWKLMLFVLFLSFVIGGVISLFLLVFRLKGRKDFIPFGPFIATAALIGVLYGQNMLTWYLDSFLR